MADDEIYLENRWQFDELHSGIQRLWINGEHISQPLRQNELKTLSSLSQVKEVTLQILSGSPAEMLSAIPTRTVQKISLSHFPVLDNSVLEALGQFKDLKELILRANYETLPFDHYGWERLAWPHLLNLEIAGDEPFCAAFIGALNAPKLQNLKLVLTTLTDRLWDTIAKEEALESLTLWMEQINLTVTQAQILSRLNRLSVYCSDPSAFLPLRALAASQRFIEVVRTRGRIGDWYEVRTREFCSSDGYMQNCPIALRPGDELKIFDPSGRTLFEGPMEPDSSGFESTWTQVGVARGVWEDWFNTELEAELTTYKSLPSKDFWLGYLKT